jgi:hypothetical protein
VTDQLDGPQRPGPIGGDMAAIVFGLTRRMQLPALTQRHSSTFVLGLFSFVNGLIAIAAMAFVAYVTGEPFVFPSLGPTAFRSSIRRCSRRPRRATRSAATPSVPAPVISPSSCSGSPTPRRPWPPR